MASILKRPTPQGLTYQARIRVRGFPTETKTFTKLADARHWAQQTEADIKNGLHFKKAESTKHTFAELVDRYIEIVLEKKRASGKFYTNQRHQLEWWQEHLGARFLSEITPAHIAELRDYLTAPRRNKAASHLLIDLWECSHLQDVALIERTMRKAAETCGATMLDIKLHSFGDGAGITGVAILAESHISIHTWPETGYVAIDVFMCGSCEPKKLFPFSRRHLHLKDPTSRSTNEVDNYAPEFLQ